MLKAKTSLRLRMRSLTSACVKRQTASEWLDFSSVEFFNSQAATNKNRKDLYQLVRLIRTVMDFISSYISIHFQSKELKSGLPSWEQIRSL